MRTELSTRELPISGQIAAVGVLAIAAFCTSGTTHAQSCVYSWSGVGGGVSISLGTPTVFALAAFDDGSGEALFVGGLFTEVGGVTAQNLAKWDGLTWTAIGANDIVRFLHVLDDGNGSRLYAGGDFSQIGGQNAATFARLENGVWTAVGPPLHATSLSEPAVLTARFYDDGSGSKLYIGGYFNIDGTGAPDGIARLEGGVWKSFGKLPSGGSTYGPAVGALEPFTTGGQTTLVAAGLFGPLGFPPSGNVASWDGVAWSWLGDGLFYPTGGYYVPSVMRLLSRVENGKPVLYASGRFSTVKFASNGGIARWDGAKWETVGGGVNLVGHPLQFVGAMEEISVGGQDWLAVGGVFASIGGAPISSLALWDGQSWSPFGNPVSKSGAQLTRARCMLPVALPTGPSLYVGGTMDLISGGTNVNSLAHFKCLSGDLNGDGKVGQEDLGILLASYGIGAGGDLDGDMDTDQADLGILLSTYGS